MREILFRGKRIVNGEWVEGFLVKKADPLPGWTSSFILVQEFDRSCIDGRQTILKPEMSWYKVAPETVGQFTGLTDKNGKKIFEGDILSTENGTFSNTGMGHILLYKGMWTSFYGQDALGRDCFDELHTVCSEREVVGNIHDNPELIKRRATNE